MESQKSIDLSCYVLNFSLLLLHYSSVLVVLLTLRLLSDNDYYSESDDDGETTSSVGESCEVASNSSSPGRNGSVTMVDGVNVDIGRPQIEHFHTTSELVGLGIPESPKIRRNSDASKGSHDFTSQNNVPSSTQSNDDVIPGKVSSVKLSEIHQSHLSSNSMKLSRSMNSLLVPEQPSKFLAASYEKARDRAFKWVSHART